MMPHNPLPWLSTRVAPAPFSRLSSFYRPPVRLPVFSRLSPVCRPSVGPPVVLPSVVRLSVGLPFSGLSPVAPFTILYCMDTTHLVLFPNGVRLFSAISSGWSYLACRIRRMVPI
jgi:hypothetical protein